MEYKVVSETIQELNGERFYLCGKYYQHNGKRLHRAGWEDVNGEIPDGYHIHHIDGNSHNNDISNLAIMSKSEHLSHHAQEESRRENGRKAIKLAIMVAPEWHHSDIGKEWHSKQAKETWRKRKPVKYVCDMCGVEYESRQIRYSGNHFCSNNCKCKYGRWKKAGKI